MEKQVQVTVEGSVYDIMGAAIKMIADVKAINKLGGGSAAQSVAIVGAFLKDIEPVLGEIKDVASGSIQNDIAAVLAQAPALIAAIKS